VIDPEQRESRPEATDTTLRQFAALWLVLFGSLSVVEFAVRHRSARAVVFAFVALIVAPAGLWRPRSIRSVFTIAMMVATPIGLLMSRVLLGVMFYLVFTPVAILFRLIGRDGLLRRRQDGVSTFWLPKEQSSDLESYLRQS
jgi:hypothetical protein